MKKRMIDPMKLPASCMPLDLTVCEPKDYVPVIEMLVHDEKFMKIVAHRQRMFDVANRPGANVSAITKGIEQDDRRAADMLLLAFIRRTMVQVEHKNVPFGDLLNTIPVSDTKRRELGKRVGRMLDMVVFFSDIIESKLATIQEDLQVLFPDENYHFEQFDGVRTALQQLASAFSLTRSQGSEEEQQLFADYAESMENYYDKRMNTYQAKRRLLRKKQSNKKKTK